jgi:hypothetical protein
LFLNLGVLQKCIENPTEEFCPNHFDYPVADCCQDEFKDKLAQGFTHITEAAFGGLTSALLARRVSKKTVELAAVPGVFTLGQKLSSEQFAQFFGKVGLNPTVTSGRLGEELYPARAYMTGSEPVGYNRGLPWGLLLTGIALLSTSIYKVRRDAQSVPLESDRFEQGRALFERGKELAEEAERFFGEASKVSKATHQQRRREVNTESEH